MTLRSFCTSLTLLLACCFASAQDSTYQRVIGHDPNSPEVRIRIRAARRAHKPLTIAKNNVKPLAVEDWTMSIGAPGVVARGQDDWTAQWNDSLQGLSTPDCTNDYSVVPVNVTPTATQANFVVFNNLYRGPSPGGICGLGQPTTLVAYRLGTTGTLGAPGTSLDGTKVTILEKSTATLHIVTLGSGGTAIAPISPDCLGTDGCDVAIDYTNTTVTNCAAGTIHHANASDVFVDYSRDEAYVSDDAGRVYVITGVYKGTPALSFCTQAGSGASAKLGIPVHINVSGVDYAYFINNGQTIRRTQVNAGRTGFTSTISRTLSNATSRIVPDALTIDRDGGFAYIWTNNDATGANAALYQLDLGLVIKAELSLGPVTTQAYNMGFFDESYLAGGPTAANATMYTCVYPNGTANVPKLADVQFSGTTGVMNTTFLMTGDANIANSTATASGNTCAPILTTYDSVAGVDQLFVGTGNGTTTNASKLTRWDITSPITSTTAAAANSNTTVPGGTSAILIDWEPSNLGAETQNIYYVNTAPSTATRCGGTSPNFNSCETKLLQSTLNN